MNVAQIMKERMSFSFEVFPPKQDKPVEPLLDTLDHLYKFKPDFVSCTYGAGGTNAGRNVEICKAIKDSGKTIPVTHFTCIGNSKEKIKRELQNYLDIGVDHILALRGDYPKGWEGTRGDFNYANELVEFIKVHFPQFTIAIAGDPEKHVECHSFDEDISHLRVKQDCGGDYIMTQLCHDVDQFQWWRDRLIESGITLPIDVGVMPVLAKDPTIRMAVSNGSGIPRDLAEVIGRYGENPEDFKKAGIEYTVKQIYKYMNAGIDGLHIYSLNKWEDVAKIVNKSGIRKMHN
ncbi:methylenetetrahydrofolate reductase (NADPH) [Alkalibaculum bacchi]|uniref:Methylenetetrahydrofolate reductase n=1 Tax=Alkalibaculum bacchi TaxID=645887 RepID=A0A366I9P8_9FIRM|nr:methylenetetrahydrofolate reductase [Alkalibaculum bacchi]RBP66673.1 methylenetetrahydrofolate reductase (NADPH) [Alkalibaculum bacchi]